MAEYRYDQRGVNAQLEFGLSGGQVVWSVDHFEITTDGSTLTQARVAAPSNANDVTTKNYVDTAVAGSVISVSDEGVQVLASPTDINFAGAGIVATDDGDGTVTVTVSGGNTISVSDEGGLVLASPTDINFAGAGVAATDDGDGTVTVTVSGSGSTNLTASGDATTVTVESDTGTDALISGATGALAGVMVAADKSKLDGIETGATADQSDAEIETAYNNQVAQVSGPEITAGTEAAIRRYSPQDITSFITTHAPASPNINTQTGTPYDLALTDSNDIVEMNLAGANTVNILAEASVNFSIGTVINITQLGAGATTVTAAAGVLLNGVDGGSATLNAQYDGVSLYKRASDEWIIQGAHGGVA